MGIIIYLIAAFFILGCLFSFLVIYFQINTEFGFGMAFIVTCIAVIGAALLRFYELRWGSLSNRDYYRLMKWDRITIKRYERDLRKAKK